MDQSNVTDTLLWLVFGLVSLIAALAAWIHTNHEKRVVKKFEKNDGAHKELYVGMSDIKVTGARTEAKVDHIIRHHDKMPEFKE